MAATRLPSQQLRGVVVCAGALVFHVVFTFSVIDVYFRTPLVHGMPPHQPGGTGPAKRLVLFVGDGLRADRFFEPDPQTGSFLAPFLRSRITDAGARFGIAHTRVPTESRPGHVALIAGFYEDVSAVTHGWKSNPVEFDTVFNRSRHTWSFGSPDIVPMFAPASMPHVEAEWYSSEFEDFAADTHKLDDWSFQHLHQLIDRAGSDTSLAAKLRQQGVVVFLHLLGLDTAGHAFRPHSREYLDNIHSVDRGIEAAVSAIEAFYQHDGGTAYLFTADHGMSNRGAHGDGDPDNTQIPFVVWGAGVAAPPVHPDVAHAPAAWALGARQYDEIQQSDVAPLMTALLGLAFPANSIGRAPRHFLAASPEYRARVAVANAAQVAEQVVVKEAIRSRSYWFRRFPKLKGYSQRLAELLDAVQQENWERVDREADQLYQDAMAGLEYYHKYDWPVIMSIITLGYLGWMLFLVSLVLRHYTLAAGVAPPAKLRLVSLTTLAWQCAVSFILALQQAPLRYHVYSGFTVVFWAHLWHLRRFLLAKLLGRRLAWSSVAAILAFLPAALVALVYSYHHRVVYSVLWAVSCVLLLTQPAGLSLAQVLAWLVCACSLAVFTLLPVDYGDATPLVLAGGAAVIVVALAAMLLHPSRRVPSVLLLQLACLAVSCHVVYDTMASLEAKQGLPLANQYAAWALALSSPLLPLLAPSTPRLRLLSVFVGFASPMVLLSVAYEVLFYACFGPALFLWLAWEAAVRSRNAKDTTALLPDGTRSLDIRDLRTAFVYLFMLNVAFFGTGNIASISSFEISSTYRFTTIFAPFLMAALLIFKLAIPFVLVSCVFVVLCKRLATHPLAIFLLAVAQSAVMCIATFFQVRDHGSWLEIGNSIGHFGLANAFLIIMLVLYGVAQVYLHAGRDRDEEDVRRSKQD